MTINWFTLCTLAIRKLVIGAMTNLTAYGDVGPQQYAIQSYRPGTGGGILYPPYFYDLRRDVEAAKLKKVSCYDPWLFGYDIRHFRTMAAPRIHKNGLYVQSPLNGIESRNYNPVYDLQGIPNANTPGLFSYAEHPTLPRYSDHVYSANSENRSKSNNGFKRWTSLSDSSMSFCAGDPGYIDQSAYSPDRIVDGVCDSMKVYASPVSSSYYNHQEDARAFQPSMRSDSDVAKLQHWPWVSPNLYGSSAMSPSSPLDSGLSSQSVASSPSIEHEETMPMRNHRTYDFEGTPYYQPRKEVRQCSCPSNIYVDRQGTHFHQWKADSGRSSPWAPYSANQSHIVISQRPQELHENAAASPYDSQSYYRTRPSDPQRDCRQCWELPPQQYGMPDRQQESSHPHPAAMKDQYHGLVSSTPKFSPCSSKDISYCAWEESQSIQGTTNSPKASGSSVAVKDISVAQETTIHNPSRVVKASPFVEQAVEPKSPNHLRRKAKEENAKNAELAISELEEIYRKLNLDDYDLLDRAERRDLPTAHQNRQESPPSHSHGLTRSKSDSFCEILGYDYDMCYPKAQRAPPMRRSGVPDRIADDMALRKQQKAAAKAKKIVGNSSYMLRSAHFTPCIPAEMNEFPLLSRPDVEYDDLSYRKYFQLKAEEPQPPFGIPLKPMISGSSTDYLHATPSVTPRALCHPRGNPDVVRDDMAYRTLRRDVL